MVIPDTAVRVFVLDFDTLPAAPAEAIPVLRFRLRKMVPFDVEHAGLSYQILTQSKTEAQRPGRQSCPATSSRNTKPSFAPPATNPAR